MKLISNKVLRASLSSSESFILRSSICFLSLIGRIWRDYTLLVYYCPLYARFPSHRRLLKRIVSFFVCKPLNTIFFLLLSSKYPLHRLISIPRSYLESLGVGFTAST